ncbi:MAG: hypothetical protein ABI321_06980 [Polyangia bacterium]
MHIDVSSQSLSRAHVAGVQWPVAALQVFGASQPAVMQPAVQTFDWQNRVGDAQSSSSTQATTGSWLALQPDSSGSQQWPLERSQNSPEGHVPVRTQLAAHVEVAALQTTSGASQPLALVQDVPKTSPVHAPVVGLHEAPAKQLAVTHPGTQR